MSKTSTSTLAFAMDQRARHSRRSRNPFRAGHAFRGYSGSRLLRPVRLLAPLYPSDPSPRPQGLLLPGFQQLGRLPRCWISLQQCLNSSVGGTSPAAEWQLASLILSGTRAGTPAVITSDAMPGIHHTACHCSAIETKT